MPLPDFAVISKPVQSIAFHLGKLSVHWYGIFVACGFLAGLWTSSIRARKSGIPAESIFDLGPWLVFGGIAGGRILYVISYWKEYFADYPITEIFMIQKGGLVFYGGLIGAIFVGIAYLRFKKLPVWKFADILAPGVAIGYFFGRFGCLMNGCCFGRECHLPWAIRYPIGHETHTFGSPALPVHPTQVYDSLLNLAFYFALNHLFYRRKFDGQVFAIYLMGYAVLRAFVEYFRGDYPVHYLGGIATPAQIISIGIVTAGIILYRALPRKLSGNVSQLPAKP